MSLKNFSNEITLLKEHSNRDKLFINNENLMHLSGTESGYEIIEAFMKDLSKNISVIKAIVTLLNNPKELEAEPIDIHDIPIVKDGVLDKFSYYRNSKDLGQYIKQEMIDEFFGENEDIKKIFRQYDSKKVLKIIYDASDIFEFIKHTSHRVKTDSIAETILKEKHIRIEAWEENHYFDIYNNIYSGKIATVYMEKQDSTVLKRDEQSNEFIIEKNPKKLELDEEFITLLNDSSHIHAIEIDEETDVNKLKKVLSEMNTFHTVVDKTFYFKIRKLGKHKAAGLYYRDFDIVAIDMNNDFAGAHEWTHHIHLNGGISREEEIKIYSSFNQFNYYGGINENKIAYYSSIPEVIARAGEFSYALYKADFKSIFNAYQNGLDYNGVSVTSENIHELLLNNSERNSLSWSLEEYSSGFNSNVYFDFLNREPEELAEFYILFQNIFQYQGELVREKNIDKSNYVDYAQTFKGRRRKSKRKFLKGIDSYRIKDIKEILKEYENGNINAMSKVDLLKAVLLSPDFSYTVSLINTFYDPEWSEFYSQEDINEVANGVLMEIAEEGVNQYNINTVKALTPFIPENMFDKFNVTNYNIDFNELSTKEQLIYYGKFKDGLLIVKSLPNDASLDEFQQYTSFFRNLERIGNYDRSIAVELDTEFNLDSVGGISTNTEVGQISQILIHHEEEYYYIPTGKGEAYKIPIFSSPNYAPSSVSELLEEHGSENNILVLDENENPEEIAVFNTSRWSKYNLIYADKLKNKSYAFDRVYPKVSYEVKGTKAVINGQEQDLNLFLEPKSSYREATDSFTFSKNGNLVKHYNSPETDLNFKQVFPQGYSEYILGNDISFEEFIQRAYIMFETFSNLSFSDIVKGPLRSAIKEKFGNEGIKVLHNLSMINFLRGKDFRKKVFDSKEPAYFPEYLATSRSQGLIDYIDFDSIFIGGSDLMESKKFITEMFDANIISKNMIIDILKNLSNSERYKDTDIEFDKLFDIYTQAIEQRLISAHQKIYQLFFNDKELILKKEVESMWSKLCSQNNEKISSKISFSEILSYMENYTFNDALIEDTKLKVIKSLGNSKAKKGLNDLVKEFRTHTDTTINDVYNIGNKNLFDYVDNIGSFTKASKEALKAHEIKIIFNRTPFEQIEDLIVLVRDFNKENRIDIDRIKTWEKGFGLLEISLNNLLTQADKFMIQKNPEKKESIMDNVIDIPSENPVKTKEISQDDVHVAIQTLLIAFEEYIESINIKKVNPSSNVHKKRILGEIENILSTVSLDDMTIENWFNENINSENIKYLRSFFSKYDLESQREYRESEGIDKNIAFVKNILNTKMKTIIFNLNSNLRKKNSKSKTSNVSI